MLGTISAGRGWPHPKTLTNSIHLGELNFYRSADPEAAHPEDFADQLLKCIHDSVPPPKYRSLSARFRARLLHRPPHPLRDEFREGLYLHVDAGAIERCQIGITVLDPDD